MATATLTGSLRTFGGTNFNHLDPVIIFRPDSAHLNQNNIFSGPDIRVTPAPDSTFTVDLERTDVMLDADAHYKVLIEWRNPGVTGDTGSGVAQHDTGWQVSVPNGNGGPIGDFARPPRPNFQMVIVSLTSPPKIYGLGAMWLQSDPSDSNNPANTGILHQLDWEN
ncbi:hypothetical protein ACFFON_15500 [Arthrobacter citreus]|uniref:hypothetical protein n=1 Tax=Arthrobacter TaxID=1663 RepID=UPI001265018E|nr:hypothetical protein [Arthrobacter gandavensis]